MRSKKQALMTVLNSLHTDARVQRAALVVSEEYELVLVGVDKGWDNPQIRQIIIDSKCGNSIDKYRCYIKRVKEIIKDNDFDLFYAHDYYSAALVPWVKRIKPKTKIIYDSHEIIIPEQGKKHSLRDLFFYYFEKKAVKTAGLVICASQDRSALMKEHYRLNTYPLSIDNISELPIIRDESSDKLLKELHQSIKAPILVYAGVLVKGRRIDTLIDIISKHLTGSLLIVGDGPDRKRLEELSSLRIPGRYYFTGSIPYEHMGAILLECDVGFISYPNDTMNNKLCAPNKIYEYASVQLPMIAPYNPTICSFFEQGMLGVVDENLQTAYERVIENLSYYKENCRLFSINHPWSHKAQQLLDAIRNL